MTSPEKRPGRPAKGSAPRTLTPFGAAVIAALGARRAALREGPRTLAELARVLDVDHMAVQHAVRGTRRLSPALKAAIIEALPEANPGAEDGLALGG
jgi:hypothetical protein